jgi:hypothetical protein
MFQKLYKNIQTIKPDSTTEKTVKATVVIVWVVASLMIAQQLTGLVVWIISAMRLPVIYVDQTVLMTILSIFIYLLAIAVVIGVPWLIKKRKTSRQEIGLHRLPSWTDIWMAPVGFVIYIVISSVLLSLATSFLPWFDINQAQNVGFNSLNSQSEYLLAFATLVVIAPIAEEVLFRGYLLGKLRKIVPVWVAILLTSLTFGAVHGAWNLAIDTFALSVVLSTLRVTTGGLWASILLHVIKNTLAFYLLFINPTFFNTLGG